MIASDKSSISTNRKSTTRFSTSHRWTMYVTRKSPRGWLKTRIFTFCVAFHIIAAGSCRHFKFGIRVKHSKSQPKMDVVTSRDPFLANVWTHVHVRYMLSPFRLSSVCLSVCPWSVTFVKFSAILLRSLVPWPSIDIHGKFYGDRPRGTPPSRGINAKGIDKYSNFKIWNAVSPKRCKIGSK